MRRHHALGMIAATAVLVIGLTACAPKWSGELTADERDVPAGMPAMLEFYTDS